MKLPLLLGPSRAGRRWVAVAVAVGIAAAGPAAVSLRAQEADDDQPNNLPTGTVTGAPLRPAGSTPPAPGSVTNPALAGNAGVIKRADQGPIDITNLGEVTYDPTGRVVTFTQSVNIVTTDASIYCDRADYNSDTHEGTLTGNVRIYRADTVIVSERAVYNFNTKEIRALDFHGERPPYEFSAIGVFSPGQGLQYNLRNGTFTTDDSSKPDFHLNSHRIRIYPDNRVVYIGSTLYIGSTPVFYFPYFFQSLDQQSGYQITPGYTSVYGAYLLAGITFPISEHLTGLVRLDYRTERGAAGGFNLIYKPNKKKKLAPTNTNVDPYASDDDPSAATIIARPEFSLRNSQVTGTALNSPGAVPTEGAVTQQGIAGDPLTATLAAQGSLAPTGAALSQQIRNKEETLFSTYFIHDDKPGLNRTSLDREPVDGNRFRIKLEDTTFITDDLFIKTDLDKLSDRYLLQDFYEGEFTKNPNPENVVSAAFYQPTFLVTLVSRLQLNNFFDATERLPELSFDVPRLPLGKSGFFWESESSAGRLNRAFDEASPLPPYTTDRYDTFNQFTYPQSFFNWLNVVPRAGFRATYYTHSAPSNTFSYNLQYANDVSDQALVTINPLTASATDLKRRQELLAEIDAFQPGGGIFRPVVDAGVEASFKLSRVYDNAESRALGLDKLQHVIQPYIDASFIEDFGVGSRKLLQFDRLLPTTQLTPIEFPQFNSIDTIDETSAVRVGVRNRLQTKRDALTFNWLEVDTFFQANIYEPDQNATFSNTNSRFSNLFNQLTFRPLPWVNLTVDAQLPVFNTKKGFTEINSSVQFQATSNLDLTIQHRYLNNNPFFVNSSLLRLNVYYRIDDNWSAGFSERYEFTDRILQAQSYTVYRDLSAFVGSFGVTVRNNGGVSDYGILLNFTLKGVPKVNLPVGFDVNSLDNQLSQ